MYSTTDSLGLPGHTRSKVKNESSFLRSASSSASCTNAWGRGDKRQVGCGSEWERSGGSGGYFGSLRTGLSGCFLFMAMSTSSCVSKMCCLWWAMCVHISFCQTSMLSTHSCSQAAAV